MYRRRPGTPQRTHRRRRRWVLTVDEHIHNGGDQMRIKV
jgi:hypothetical protein